MGKSALAGESRVWLIKQPGPAGTIEYIACAKAGDPSWGLGSVERSECPDPEVANRFVNDREWRTARERASTNIMTRYSSDLSDLLALAREGCFFDLHILWGECSSKNSYLPPSWAHIDAYPAAAIETWGAENYGALQSDDQSAVNETADITAAEVFQIGRLAFTELAKTTIVREIVAVSVCDTPSCGGTCGAYSSGCSKVFAVQVGVGATPGTKPAVIYSKDGGVTPGSTDIDTMFSNETPTGATCMGPYLVITASTSNSLHWAETADILAGTEIWTETNTGFVAGGEPQAIWAPDSQHCWIVGNGGYVYFTSDPTVSVTVQDAGVATTQTLNDVHALDSLHALAVGTFNAVIHTDDGETWEAVTGPAAGLALTACWMYSEDTWIVCTANGLYYYTQDAGVSWTQVLLPGAIDNIYDIAFTQDGKVGYIAGSTGGVAKLLRSTAYGIAGTWYVLPESTGNIPDADRINSIAVCEEDVNTVYAGGLGGNATDGYLIKGSA